MRLTPRVLLLPGWHNSGADHWQTRWQHLHGFERVEQADWVWPRRGDWMAQLEEAVRGDEDGAAQPAPVVLVAHSLGCHLVAAWAAHTQHAARVAGALLVAPPDVTRPDLPPQLHGWRQPLRQPLPFKALVLCSDDDPYADIAHTTALAADWGAPVVSLGAAGHVNGASGLGDWPDGLQWLQRVMP